MPPLARRHRTLGRFRWALALTTGVVGCGASASHDKTPSPAAITTVESSGLELHESGGRPRIVIVRREGDPQPAIAIEIRLREGTDEAGERTAAIAALIAARLERVGVAGVQALPSAQFVRVRGLAPQLGAQLATTLDDALRVPIAPIDPAIPAIQRALEAFFGRAVDDPALARAARCLDRPTRPAKLPPLAPSSKDLAATVESWRREAMAADAIVIGVVGGGAGLDSFLSAWSSIGAIPKATIGEPALQSASKSSKSAPPSEGAFVSLTTKATEGALLVIEGAPRAVVPKALTKLLDPASPLMLRLRGADEWRAKGISGSSRAEGGCLVIELEPSPRARIAGTSAITGTSAIASKDASADRITMRAAIALEVARQEIERAIDEAKSTTDAEAARFAIASGGDARETADRAAWWGFSPTLVAGAPLRPTFTLTVPAPPQVKGATAGSTDVDVYLAALKAKLDSALDRARLAWARSEIDLRSRVEPGQGELWAVLGSTCGVSHETGADAGLGSLAMSALVSTGAARAESDGVSIESWGAPNGLGVVAHATARPSESPKSLALRVGDAVARAFLATFPDGDDVAAVRADALVALAGAKPPGDLVHEVLRASSPERPSWLSALGAIDPVARTGLESIELRLATLRASPLRLAVLANTLDTDQIAATLRAADRWAPRRPGETRTCPVIDAGALSKGAIHPIAVKSGTGVAFAFPVDESQREAAQLLAQVLQGVGGRLAMDVAPAGLATLYDARLVRGIGRSALVVVALAPESNLDALVQRLRALFEQLRTGALKEDDLARAERETSAALVLRRLEPRARVVDLFLDQSAGGDPAPVTSTLDLARLRAVAGKVLDEDHAQLVVARLK